MYKIAIVGLGSIGYRYFQAISRIKYPKIKLFIIDKKIKSVKNRFNLVGDHVETSKDLKLIPKQIDLCIISTTCQNRPTLLRKIIKLSKFKNLILEKPLTQSHTELIELNKILTQVRNVWVNTDRRCLDVYRFVKSEIDKNRKISMKVEGNSWGICCNSLHFVDLFNFLSDQNLVSVIEKSPLKWFPAKRKGFQEIDNTRLELKFGHHDLFLSSKKNSLPKNLKIIIKNKKKIFSIKEKPDIFELKYNNKILTFKNNPTSIKMTNIIKRILLKNKSNLPSYINSSKLYYPLIEYFLKKWRIRYPKSIKAQIT